LDQRERTGKADGNERGQTAFPAVDAVALASRLGLWQRLIRAFRASTGQAGVDSSCGSCFDESGLLWWSSLHLLPIHCAFSEQQPFPSLSSITARRFSNVIFAERIPQTTCAFDSEITTNTSLPQSSAIHCAIPLRPCHSRRALSAEPSGGQNGTRGYPTGTLILPSQRASHRVPSRSPTRCTQSLGFISSCRPLVLLRVSMRLPDPRRSPEALVPEFGDLV
jgi:hypothetical protein